MKNFKFLREENDHNLTHLEINYPTASFNHIPNNPLDIQGESINQNEYNRRRDAAAAAEEAQRRYNLLHEMRTRQNHFNSTSTNSIAFYSGISPSTKIKPKFWTRIKMYFQEYFYIDPIGLAGLFVWGALLVFFITLLFINKI